MEYQNYIKIRKLSLRFRSYFFVDTGEYLADGLFIKNKITVHFGEEFAKENLPYRFVCCKIRKKDEKLFLKSMEELKKKMLLTGYMDYPEFCSSIIEPMLAQSRRKCYNIH